MPLSAFNDTHGELVRRLLESRRRDRTGHAYVFVGDDIDFLEAFGRMWLQVCACRQPAETGDACGECRNCRDFARGCYAELYELRPESKSRQILVDDIRQLEHQLQLTTDAKHPKMALIVEGDRVGEQAQNAFLKTLEEPPARSMLLLLTTQPRLLLPTIRSRCQMVSVRRNRQSYEFAIEAGFFVHLTELQRGAGAAVGLRVAHRIGEMFAVVRDLAAAEVGDESPAMLELAEQDRAMKKRLEAQREARLQAEYLRFRNRLCDAIHVWFLQASLVAYGVPSDRLPHPELIDAAGVTVDTLRAVPPAAVEASLQATETLVRLLAGNVDERLAVEAFCLTICQKASN